jgi:tetratricopeptide (TPR) repeat protein
MTENPDRLTRAQDAVTRLRELAGGQPARYRRGLALALVEFGFALFEVGRHADALTAVDDAIAIVRGAVSKDLDDRATALSDLAAALQARFEVTGDLAPLNEAVTVQRRALAETHADNRDRTALLSNLGNALRKRFERTGVTADLAETVKLQRQAIDAAPADGHDHTALLSNLGTALRLWFEVTGDIDSLDEAVAVFRQAVSATRQGNPNRTLRLSNLGAALRARFGRTGEPGDLAEAESLLRLAISEAPSNDGDQPALRSNLGDVLRDLADVLNDHGKLAEARSEFAAALASRERMLGLDHPDTLASRNNLASVLAQTGKLAEAESEFRALAEHQSRVLGPDHPDALASRNNLASVLAQTGKLAEAESEFRALAEHQSRVLGPDHPDALASRNNLASVLAQTGKLAEAESEFRAVLDSRQVVLGPEHPDTLTTRALLTGARDALAKARTKPEVHHQGWPATHRAILAIDIATFTSARADSDRLAMRDVLYDALKRSMANADVPWGACAFEDRGDGVLVLISPEVPKIRLVAVADELEAALRTHNAASSTEQRMRLRLAIHAGEVRIDANGVVGTAIIHAFRLLDAPPVRAALSASENDVASVVSDWFYQEVVRHDTTEDSTAYQPVEVRVKETVATAWVRMPEAAPRAEFTEWSRPHSHTASANSPQVMVELTDALLAVPAVADESGRRLLIGLLRPEIAQAIPYHPRARMHLMAIVRACLQHEGGFELLLDALRTLEPASMPLRSLEATLDRILPSHQDLAAQTAGYRASEDLVGDEPQAPER